VSPLAAEVGSISGAATALAVADELITSISPLGAHRCRENRTGKQGMPGYG